MATATWVRDEVRVRSWSRVSVLVTVLVAVLLAGIVLTVAAATIPAPVAPSRPSVPDPRPQDAPAPPP